MKRMINNINIFSITKILRWKQSIVLFVISIENSKTQKFHTFSKNHKFFLLLPVIVTMKMEKY